MSETEKLDWSVVWVLAAIHLADGIEEKTIPKAYKKMIFRDQHKKYKNLLQIIYVGDYINRAIFTDKELLEGIDHLITLDLIEVKDNTLITTENLKKLYNEITANKKKVSIDSL